MKEVFQNRTSSPSTSSIILSMRCQIQALQLMTSFLSKHYQLVLSEKFANEVNKNLKDIENILEELVRIFDKQKNSNDRLIEFYVKKEFIPTESENFEQRLDDPKPREVNNSFFFLRESANLDHFCGAESPYLTEPFENGINQIFAQPKDPLISHEPNNSIFLSSDQFINLVEENESSEKIEDLAEFVSNKKRGAGRKTVDPLMEQKMVSWTKRFIIAER